MINFDKINEAALFNLQTLLNNWLPGGRIEGADYVALNPTRSDKEAGSFKINLQSCVWMDFATNDKGNDPISLYAYINGIRQGEAAKELARQLNIPMDDKTPFAPQAASTPSQLPFKKKSDWTIVYPIPDDAPPKPESFNRLENKVWVSYKIGQYWAYTDEHGKTIGYACRYEKPHGGKEVVPLAYWKNSAGKREWKFLSFPDPRPLYNLGRLYQFPDYDVIGVEGEKCADALQLLFDNHKIPIVVITWPGGCKAVRKTNWKPLNGRVFTYWPDSDKKVYDEKHPNAGEVMRKLDQPGFQAALTIADIVGKKVKTIKIVDTADNKPDGWDCWDAINTDKWTLQDVQEFISKNSIAPPDADYFLAENPLKDAPFKCLGYDREYYYYLPHATGQIKGIKGEGHTANALLTLAPLSWWWSKFPGKKGFPDWQRGVDAVLRGNEERSVYDPTLCRGRGAWWDRGRVIMHLGDHLMVDGDRSNIADIDSQFVYESGRAIRDIQTVPLPDDESKKLIEIMQCLHWENPIHSLYVAGWCFIATICGALSWRPHIWVTGSSGSGKTTVLQNIIAPTLGPFRAFFQSKSTAAGIRQKLASDALPVLFDESERDMEDVLELMRQSSSQTDAKITKGSKYGRAQEYDIRSVFCLSSITVNMPQHADETRVVVATLQVPTWLNIHEREVLFAGLNKKIATTMTPEWCAALRARAIKQVPVLKENCLIFARAVSEKLGNRRSGDQIGTLLAGTWGLMSNALVDESSLNDFIKDFEPSQMQDPGVLDERNCLDAILQHTVLLPKDRGHKSISEMLAVLTKLTGVAAAYEDETDVLYKETLKRLGIRITEDKDKGWLVWISDSHTGIKRILEKTTWSQTWGRLLRRLPGAEGKNCVRFFGASTRATGIPWSTIYEGED